ncbi:unnamed protein product [Clonostachys rosea]|uniref:Zn(2)-C6 fungal-type domain-containing protein n=1 Tax=Bionectria ochroleuca TaxID=29856 RepID=A0ABY6UNP9_BIOOC|nr:unnamed protein product [Clonostachys rosea]
MHCRLKKVKCDGRHPSCAACLLRHRECEYPRDARRSALRTKKEHVTALQQQVDVLQRQLRSKSDQATVSVADYAEDKYASPTACYIAESASASSEPQLTPNSCIAAQPSRHDISGVDALEKDTKKGGVPRDDAGLGSQFYGATSLLRDQSTLVPLTPLPDDAKRHKAEEQTKDMSRDMLISYSAIQRQHEAALRSGPSISSRIDFDLVDADVALHLLDLHWNRQHLSYLLTYRPAIMDSLISGGPYVNKLLLNAIYFQSSRYSDRYGSEVRQQRGEVFLNRFNALLGQHIGKPTIPTIVALLTCGACLVPHGKQSAGWIYCGIAYRMITDLGLHLEPVTELRGGSMAKADAINIEIRRRVYWAAYVGDKLQSLFLGRAPAILKSSGTVSRDYLDTYEELEEWAPYFDALSSNSPGAAVPVYNGRPCYALSTFRWFLELCDISEILIDGLYSVKSLLSTQEYLLQKRDEILDSIIHCTLAILNEQAFLGSSQLKVEQDDASLSRSKQICIQSAMQIWKLVGEYKRTFTLRRAQYGIAYATYCATLVILQHADQDSSEYLSCIKFFWDALWEFQRGCNCGLKRPLRLLKTLMGRMEMVARAIRLEEEGEALPADWPDINTFQANLESVIRPANIDNHCGGVADTLLQMPDIDDMMLGDSMFGMADDSFYGNYM